MADHTLSVICTRFGSASKDWQERGFSIANSEGLDKTTLKGEQAPEFVIYLQLDYVGSQNTRLVAP
jgi:hypothetical protein